MSWKPLVYKRVTSLAAAKTIADLLDATLLSGGVPVAAVHFLQIQPEAQAVKWTTDGTTPTATTGNLLAVGDTMTFQRGELNALKVIEVATSATLNCQPYQNG